MACSMNHLAGFAKDACKVVHALAHERDGVCLQRLHAKLAEVWLERDRCPVFIGFASADLGCFLLRHVASKYLRVFHTCQASRNFCWHNASRHKTSDEHSTCHVYWWAASKN